MKTSNNKKQLDYSRDIEPIIKKYQLENNDDCKKAVELIRQNDPKGYNQLGALLSNSKPLNLAEQRIVFKMTEKAAEMGLDNARFNIGGSYLMGIGVGRDVGKGITILESTFLMVFSKVFTKYPYDSVESTRMCELHNRFVLEMGKFLKAVDSSKDLNVLKKRYVQLIETTSLISYVYETGDVSILM